MKKILILMGCFLLTVWQLSAQTEQQLQLEIYQIKVSKGHATLVVVKGRTGSPFEGKIYSSTLIDAGNGAPDGELIRKAINLNAKGRLDKVFVTHHDGDHYKGLPGNNGIFAKHITTDYTPDNRNLTTSYPYKLELYMSTVSDNSPDSDKMQLTALNANYSAKLRVVNWIKNQDINLGPKEAKSWDAIKFRTLAINGYLRNELSSESERMFIGTENVAKNNKSGVLAITWGDFSFLIQGDLYSDGNDGKIVRTKKHYRPNSINDLKRLPTKWTGATSQNARMIKVSNEGAYREDPTAIYSRALNSDLDKPTISYPNTFPVTPDDQFINKYPYKIAFIDKPRHQLGETINTYNGLDKYAHACVALLPHHGAVTANLWIDSAHGIIGSPRSNKVHGHPNMQAMQAAYHTAGIRNFYFTYLFNNSAVGSTKRLTEFENLKNTYFNSLSPGEVNHFYLDDKSTGTDPNQVGTRGNNILSYYKVAVISNIPGNKIREFSISTDQQEIRPMAQCERGH